MARIKTFHLQAKDKTALFRRAHKAIGQKVRIIFDKENGYFYEGHLVGVELHRDTPREEISFRLSTGEIPIEELMR